MALPMFATGSMDGIVDAIERVVEKIEITNIEYKKYDEPINTYNLTVDGNSNYFVTDIQVLVHNVPSLSILEREK